MIDQRAQKQAKKTATRPIKALGTFTDEIGKVGSETRKALMDRKWVDDTFQQLMSLGFGSDSPLASPPEGEGGKPEGDPTKGLVEVFNAAKLRPNEIVERKVGAQKLKEKGGNRSGAEAGIDYDIKNSGEKHLRQENQRTNQTLEQMQSELQQIVRSASNKVKVKFAPHTLGYTPRNAGIYQKGFVQNLIVQAKSATAESGNWLQEVKGKNAKKGKYDPSNGMQHSTGEKTTIQNSAG